MKLVFIICLLNFLTLPLEAQSGRYEIDTIEGKDATGEIFINPYYIRINQDSTSITLPVVEVVEEKRRTIYILEGCQNNQSFRGSAVLVNYEVRPRDGRYGLALYIELRTKSGYSFTRYGIYYLEE